MQDKLKPKIDDMASEYLDGDVKTAATEFIAYLRSEKMSPQWLSTNKWKACYKQKAVCFISMQKGIWAVLPCIYNTSNPCDPGDFDKFLADNNMQEFIWSGLKDCRNCLPCTPGKSMIVAGKEFQGKYGFHTVQFPNPDEKTIDSIKKVLDYKKKKIEIRLAYGWNDWKE